MLALTFVHVADYDKIRQDDDISILNFDSMSPGKNLVIQLKHADNTVENIETAHTYNQAQIDWVKWGSALNQIRAELSK